MQNQFKFYQTIPGIAAITILLLLIPLVAMQFTSEVNWGIVDFLIAGLLIFGAGSTFVLITRSSANLVYRAGFGLAIAATLLLVWANLSVGLIGSGPNAGNLMYIGVVLVVVAGAFLSRFTPRGMQQAMFVAALSLVLIAVIALLANMHQNPGSSIIKIIGINAFFASLYAIAGLLFRHVTVDYSQEKS